MPRKTSADTTMSYPVLGKLLALGFGLFLLVVLELVARLALPESHLDRILDILQQDATLFWRQRPELNTMFAGTEVTTNEIGLRIAPDSNASILKKQAEVPRIVCMGASPTFGWGVTEKQAYSRRLEPLLSEKLGKPVEVINGGMIGYSSLQGARFFEREILPLQPDWITVSYVINDVDKYRFFRTDGRPDRELKPLDETGVWLRNLLMKSAFYRLYERSLHVMLQRRGQLDGKPLRLYRPGEVRVPPQDYVSNLATFADLCKQHHIGLLFVAMPINLPVGKKLSAKERQRASEFLQEGLRLAAADRCEQALEPLQKAVELNPDASEAHYQLGVCYSELGKEPEARAAFDAAMLSEAHRCGADGLRYNDLLREFAGQRRIPLADVASVFRNEQEELFLVQAGDPIHPNAKGHAIIARLLAETLSNFMTR